jgi:hypothetical protein
MHPYFYTWLTYRFCHRINNCATYRRFSVNLAIPFYRMQRAAIERVRTVAALPTPAGLVAGNVLVAVRRNHGVRHPWFSLSWIFSSHGGDDSPFILSNKYLLISLISVYINLKGTTNRDSLYFMSHYNNKKVCVSWPSLLQRTDFSQ